MNELVSTLPSRSQPSIRRYAYRSVEDVTAAHPLRRRTDPKLTLKPVRISTVEPSASESNTQSSQETIGILVFRLHRKKLLANS